MGGEWTPCEIGDVFALHPGFAFRSQDFISSGIPVIKIKNVKADGLVLDDMSFVDESFLGTCGKYLLRDRDILITLLGNRFDGSRDTWVGKVAQFRKRGNYLLNQRVAVLRAKPNSKVDNRCCSYILSSNYYQQLFIAIATSSGGQANLSSSQVLSAEILLPPLPEQHAIAYILGSLDDKIESNRRMNETLESIARALFKSCVDFDPVRAKVEKRDTGLPREIADLFPEEFEDSELGEIPRGWIVTSLGDQITASKGLSYKGKHLCNPGEGLPMHNLNSVYEGGGYKYEGLKWYNGEHRPSHLLEPGDVIVTNTEQGFDHLLIGYAAIVPKRYGPQGLSSHHIFRIQQKKTSHLPTWFTYLMLRTQRFHCLVAGHSNGTTVNMLPLDGLQKPRFVLPPRQVVERFGRLFSVIEDRIELIENENSSLVALRDLLLPKLISGELRIGAAYPCSEEI